MTQLKARTKNSLIVIRELFSTDDSAVISHSATDIQVLVDKFAKAASQFSLKINIKKKACLHQSMWRTNRSQCAKISPILAVQSQNPLVSTKKSLWEWVKLALPTGNFRKDCGETDMLPSGLNVRYIVLLCSVHSSAMQRLGPYTSHSLLLRRFVFSQCRGKRLVMNRKRPWEGYRQQLSPSRLPLRAHFHRERDVWVRDSTSHKWRGYRPTWCAISER